MKPELRVFLLKDCIINPPPKPTSRVSGLAGVFVPKLIELALGGIATFLKKAGAVETEQVTGAEVTNFFVTDDKQQLSINRDLGCVLGIYGVFADEDKQPTPVKDATLKLLEARGLMPKDADIEIVFEAAIVPTSDETAFHVETRHFSVRDFIGDRHKPDRVYVATFSITTPSSTADGSTIAVGNVALGRVGKETLPISPGSPLGSFPRYRSNLMPWKRITEEAKEAYDSDAKRNEAKNKAYMPVTFNLTISETADGNKFLATLGELLEGAKADAAKELSKLILPDERQKAAKEKTDAAETLYQNEEDAIIAVKQAEADLAAGSTAQKEVLAAKLAKARRALEVAIRLRKAAGLPDFPVSQRDGIKPAAAKARAGRART
jgi:hypothetical protein